MVARLIVSLVFLELFAGSCLGTGAVITRDLQDRNVSVGAPEVEFVCEVSGASSCNWLVNEEYSANHIFVVSKLKILNSLMKDEDANANDNSDITCFMTVPTEPAHLLNGTRVQCLPLVALGGYNFMEMEGITSKLLLQGQYASVGDIHFSNESFVVEARWNHPYHLVNVPPTGYNCTISILSTGEYLNTTVNHENTTCSFVLEEDQICDVLIMEVVAYNQWTGGDTEIAYWSLGGSVRPSSIAHVLSYGDGPYFRLSVQYEVVGVCLEQVQQVVVTGTCSPWTRSNVWNVSDTSVLENGAILNATIDDIPEDRYCFFVISLMLSTMESVNTSMRKFSTFDLEDVIVTPIDDQQDHNLCVTCTLREGSGARGCLVSLKLQKGNQTLPSNFTVGRDRSERCTVQEPGLYNVEVFDYHADGNLSTLPAYSQENFRIPHTMRPPPVVEASPSTASVNPAMPTGLPTNAIVGLSVGGVVFLALLLLPVILVLALVCKQKSDKKGSPTFELTNRGAVHDSEKEMDALESTPSPEPKETSKPHKVPQWCLIITVIVLLVLVLTLLGAVLYFSLAPKPQCEVETTGDADFDGKSLQKREQDLGNHEVVVDGNAFQKHSEDDQLQEYFKHCYPHGKPQVMVFHHQSEQDKRELLSFVHGRYYQVPTKGCMENVTQWTNVKPEQISDVEV